MATRMNEHEKSEACGPVRYDFSLLSGDDVFLFNEGSHFRLYEKLGAHPAEKDGTRGAYFAVWAPNARQVSVMGAFNGWNKTTHPLRPHASSGIWEGFIPGLEEGAAYKFHIFSHQNNFEVDKTDPFAFWSEVPPRTASRISRLDYEWHDGAWMRERGGRNSLNAPISIYELHLGSWRRAPGDGHRPLDYREMARDLVPYLTDTGFTHVEFLPVMEHPFYGSWGYQGTGYFAPTSRYGRPQDFMYLVDELHKSGIGVILDWVPSHFPTDEHGLAYFDGTHLFEHADPRQGHHPDWDSYIFNYGRSEVRSFLVSSAFYWLDKYHIDGLRVDAVASMLYLDYSRKAGEWIPNKFGGRENLEAIDFLRRLNTAVYESFPDVQTIAEESTSWPMVSRPTYLGGLGFGLKWDMGWMHDTLEYFRKDPVHRKYHQFDLTFRMIYAFNENFTLSLSHDEVVHGKQSLLGKMPGDAWQKFANLRLLYGWMYALNGKKLMFMGSEFGQGKEWNHDQSLDWHQLDIEAHSGIRNWVRDLNRTYKSESALHERDFGQDGFEWVDCTDTEQSVMSFIRHGVSRADQVLCIFNFTPTPRSNYILGVPRKGHWREILNSDSTIYGGTGHGNLGGLDTVPIPSHGKLHSLNFTLPPLGVLFLKSENNS